MRISSQIVLTALTIVINSAGIAHTSAHLDVSLGFTPSKSGIGLGYGNEKHEVTVGLKNNPLSAFLISDHVYQPGISYNRFFGLTGVYASASYTPIYVMLNPQEYVATKKISYRESFTGDSPFWGEGWNSGEIFLGLGKTFQGKRLGFTLDANLITPVTKDLGKSWSHWIGFGFSYRFNLD